MTLHIFTKAKVAKEKKNVENLIRKKVLCSGEYLECEYAIKACAKIQKSHASDEEQMSVAAKNMISLLESHMEFLINSPRINKQTKNILENLDLIKEQTYTKIKTLYSDIFVFDLPGTNLHMQQTKSKYFYPPRSKKSVKVYNFCMYRVFHVTRRFNFEVEYVTDFVHLVINGKWNKNAPNVFLNRNTTRIFMENIDSLMTLKIRGNKPEWLESYLLLK